MIWVLTKEYNDYRQHGEYYVKAWTHQPTPAELMAHGVPDWEVDHVLKGGGRNGIDDEWFNLNTER